MRLSLKGIGHILRGNIGDTPDGPLQWCLLTELCVNRCKELQVDKSTRGGYKRK